LVNIVFKLPNSPEEFGVALAPAELRSLDFSALDFNMLERAGTEYIRSYFPSDFNDFYASNGVIMMLELVSYIGGILSERSDILVDESFLSTAQTKQAVIQHLELINQEFERATPAVVDVEVTIPTALPSEVRVPAGTRFNLTSPDNKAVNYEIYRAPNDFSSYIVIPPGKRGIVAYGIEGNMGTPVVVVSAGGVDQYVDIMSINVIDEPITVDVQTGTTTRRWRRVETVEKSDSNDEVYEVRHLGDRSRVIFGDNQAGKAPIAGQTITVGYRLGGGIRGRIAAGILNETRPISPQPPVSAAVEVLFRNLAPSSGGTDEETIEQAKRRAPRQWATHGNAVTGEDYGFLALNFKHPVFGAVAKAIGVMRTGVDQDFNTVANQIRAASSLDAAVQIMQTNFINRNIVEVYVLAEGPDNIPVKPNTGLKQGLKSYLEEINVLTDEIRVYEGAIRSVNVEVTIVISRSSDPGVVKVAIQKAIDDFFDLRNFDMGTGLFLSNFYQALQVIPGVKFVNIFNPKDDILSSNSYSSGSSGSIEGRCIGFNEIITKGTVSLKFFYEPGGFHTPVPTNVCT
jgi:hypothetical protein